MNKKPFYCSTAKVVIVSVIVTLALAALPMMSVLAGGCSSVASGSWSAPATWSVGCTGTGGVPGAGDDVVITNGNNVIFDPASATVNSLTINGGGTATSVTISGSNALTVTGNVTVNTPTGNVTNAVAVGAGTLNVGGNLNLPASATGTRKTQLTISTGTATVTGNITNANSTANSQVVFTGAGTLNVGGSYASGGTFTKSTGTVNFNGAAQTIPAYAYNNLTYSGSGVKTMSTGTTIGGALTLSGTASATTVENTTVGGALVVGPRTALSTGGNYTLTVTGASTIGGTLTLNGSGTKTFTGDVTINDGGFWDELGAAAVNFGGNFTNNGLYSASSTGVHTFSGSTKTISGANAIAMPYLTINGTTTNAANLTVASTLAGSSTLTNGAGATLTLGGLVSVTTFTPSGAGNTVIYNGPAQTVRAAAYVNLTLAGTGVKTIQSGATSVTGNMVLDGTSGAVSATTAANLAITGSLTVGGNTSLSTASTYTLSVGTTTTVNGTLDLESTGTSTFTGDTTINNGGTLTLGSTGGKTFTGNLTINAGGTYNESGVATLANAGNLTNSGTYYANTGVHSFTGTGKTISGTLAIPNLTISGTTTNAGTLTVSTALAGAGTLTNTGTLNYGGVGAIGPTLTASAAGNTVNYNGAAQTVKVPSAGGYSNLILSGSGAKTMATGATATNLSIDPSGGTAKASLSNALTVTTLALGGTGQPAGTYNSGNTPNYFATATNLTVSSTTTTTTPTITFTAPLPTPTYLGADFSVPATTSNTDTGNGALVYSVVSGPCTLVSGDTFHATGAGACVVQASDPASTHFFAALQTQSVTIAKANQATVTVSATPTTTVQGYTSQLTAGGGSGTGSYTYDAGSSTGCTVNASSGLVTITNASGTCQLTATRGYDTNYNTSAASAPVTITMAALDSEINKSFSSGSNSIVPGTEVQLTITVFNPNTFNLLNEAWTDNLVGHQPGIYLVQDPTTHNVVEQNTCSYSSITANPGGTTIAVSGGTVPAKVGSANGSCVMVVNVSSITPGNLINDIAAGASTATGSGAGAGELAANTTPANATLLVVTITPPGVSKTFTPNTIWAGDKSRMTIYITNNDPNALTNMSLTDALPGGVTIASPANASQSNCGSGSVTTPDSGHVSISGATLPAGSGSVCTIQVDVTSSLQGTYTNTILAGAITSDQGVTNAQPASAPLNVQQLNLTKGFSPASIAADATSTATITFQNPSATAYTNAGLIDTLPAGLTVSGTPTTTCAGGTFNTSVNTQLDLLQTATIPAGSIGNPGFCTVTFTVLADPNLATSVKTNTIAAGSLHDDQGISNPTSVSANLSVTNGLTGAKSWAPSTIVANGTATATITLSNWTASALTNVNFTDNLLASYHLTVLASPTPATTCPAGSVTFTTTSVTFTNGTIPASVNSPSTAGTCTITFIVQNDGTVTSPTNTIAANGVCANSGAGPCNLAAFNAKLNINAAGAPVSVSKAFQNAVVAPGATNRLIITLTAPLDTSVSHMGMSDSLPTGLLIAASPAPVTTCTGDTGILDPTPGTNGIGTNLIQLGDNTGTFGANLAANASCTITVYVQTSGTNAAGAYTNTIPINDVVTAEGRTNTVAASASFQVTGLTMIKAFYPTVVAAGGYSTLTITLDNASSTALSNVNLTDALTTMGSAPNNVVIGKTTYSNTCGGTLTAPVVGATSIVLTNGSIPAKSGSDGICTISVIVQGLGSDTTPRTNTIPIAGVSASTSTSTINPSAAATATLTVSPLTMTANKSFSPVIITGGSTSTLSITLNNPTSLPLTGINFTDSMVDSSIPSKGSIQLTNPVTLNPGTCTGPDGKTTSVVMTGNPGDNHFAVSNIDLPANTSCTLTVTTTTTVNGTLTNTIPAGGISSFNGVATTSSTAASLTNLPGLGVSKGFSTNPIAVNSGVSTLTITLTNTGSTDETDIGLVDQMPAVLAASSPNNTCGGTATITAELGHGWAGSQSGHRPGAGGWFLHDHGPGGICYDRMLYQHHSVQQPHIQWLPDHQRCGQRSTVHREAQQPGNRHPRYQQ